MSNFEHIDLKQVQKVRISEDDVLVLHLDEALTMEQRDKVGESIAGVFGERRKALILDRGTRLTIVSKAAE